METLNWKGLQFKRDANRSITGRDYLVCGNWRLVQINASTWGAYYKCPLSGREPTSRSGIPEEALTGLYGVLCREINDFTDRSESHESDAILTRGRSNTAACALRDLTQTSEDLEQIPALPKNLFTVDVLEAALRDLEAFSQARMDPQSITGLDRLRERNQAAFIIFQIARFPVAELYPHVAGTQWKEFAATQASFAIDMAKNLLTQARARADRQP